MRVIAGKARSLPLKTPKGEDTRPTTDRIKETLFNILMPNIPNAIFVDLFAGSGGIGIEALSRGAQKAYFIEQNGEAANCIVDNLKFTKLTDQSVLMKQDVYSALYNIHEKEIDILFADPPYQDKHEEKIISVLKDMPYITADSLIIIEALLDTDFDFVSQYGFEIVREKRYKTNKHIFIKKIS